MVGDHASGREHNETVVAGRCNLWNIAPGAVTRLLPKTLNMKGRPQCRPFVCLTRVDRLAISTCRKGHGAKSAPARERAILALLSERTMGQAAARCGVGERTLRRWLTEDSEFKAEFEAARSAMFQVGMSRIQALAGRAVETLEDLLGAKQYPAVRLGAARTVAEIGMHQYDADTILRKLDKVEAAQRQRRQ